MLKRISFILLFLMTLLFAVEAQVSIKPNFGKYDIWKYSPYEISIECEPDSGYNRLLSQYVYRSLINETINNTSKDSLLALFKRPSFKKCIVFICNNYDQFLEIFYPDSPEIRYDYTANLLYNCSDTTILNNIVSDLLYSNNDIGLLGIWKNYPTYNKIPGYNEFEKWAIDNSNIYTISELIIINHNVHDFISRDRLLLKLKKILIREPKLWKSLNCLLNNNEFISYEQWLNSFYESIE